MNNNDKINRIKIEDYIWILFIGISIISIYGNYNQKKYLETNNKYYSNKANNIFKITLRITFLIYIYFFIRNYEAYEQASSSQKELFKIKILGSTFLITGILCLIYFQNKQTLFIGSPAP